MQQANVGIWTATGAIVGAFLMPSTWLLLLYMTAGRALPNNLNNLGGTLGDESLGATGGDPANLPPEVLEPQPAADTPGWIVALLVISLLVTVLSAVFFGWVGRRLATNARQHATV